tara:strand:- start:6809 stop:7567 length:759 start_codon:yes stop_codon:yes gene_type:complete
MINLFIRKSIINNKKWPLIKCQINFDSVLYKNAVIQAKKKSAKTMNASQSGAYRSPEMKYNMQLMGIIAEIACAEYLKEIIKRAGLKDLWSVIRYDDVRTDNFGSPLNEYDIMIKSNHTGIEKKIYVESRSSITYNRSLQSGLVNYDIIGPYTSAVKSQESANDFYLRPLYEYKDYHKNNYSKLKFEEFLKDGKIILYIVSGCTYLNLIEEGIKKSMSQQGSKYLVLPIKKSINPIELNKLIINRLNSVENK